MSFSVQRAAVDPQARLFGQEVSNGVVGNRILQIIPLSMATPSVTFIRIVYLKLFFFKGSPPYICIYMGET